MRSSIADQTGPARHPSAAPAAGPVAGPAAATAAAAWAVGFAALSAYWALGGTLGTGILARGLVEQAEARAPDFVALLWLAAGLKALLAAPALALREPRSRRTRRAAVLAASVIGGGLVLYGAAGFTDFALMATGVRGVPSGVGEHAVLWYLGLWEPLWILGGAVFLIAARNAPPPRREAATCPGTRPEPAWR